MISKADAQAIVYALDPSMLVRLAYRAASEAAAAGLASPGSQEAADGAPEVFLFGVAAVVLDLYDGALRARCWHETDSIEMPPHLVVLAYADTALVEEIERRHGEGCALPPSPEVLEESVARAAAADGIGVSWTLLEAQLRVAYDADEFAGYFDPGDRFSGVGDDRPVDG